MKRFSSLVAVIFVILFTLVACSQHMGTVNLSAKSPVLARIQKNNKLVIGTAANMPPMNMTTKDGKVIGLEIDLAMYMADSMGVQLKVKPMPFAKLLPSLEAGKIDMIISGMTMTAKRNMRVAFVGPYYVSGKGILTTQATLAKIKRPDQVDDPKYKIAALEGSTSEEFVKEVLSKATLVPTKDYDEAIDLVRKGEVTAMLADHPICIIAVALHPKDDLFTIVAPFTHEPYGIALPPYDPLFVNWVENFLARLEGSGAMQNLKDYWFENPEWIMQLR